MQIDKVAVQRDIPAKQLEDESAVGVEREQLQEELGGIDEKCESDRPEEEDWAIRPNLTSEDWRAIAYGYGIPTNSYKVSTQIQHWETIKSQNWRAKPTEDQWPWLEALSLFHRRRQVMGSTEEIGGLQREKGIYRIVATEKKRERDCDIADRRRQPMLAIPEKANLLYCDRPFAEEEWGAMPLDIKWGTLGILKFPYRGEKKVKLEGDTAKVAPVSAKPPPPAAPPSTYSRDRDAGKGGKKKSNRFKMKVDQKEKENPKEERHRRK